MARLAVFLIFFSAFLSGGAAQTAKSRPVGSGRTNKTKGANVRPVPAARLVAYDARDRRYYDLTWAKAHQMRDPAGDVLVALPINRLPKGTNPAIAWAKREWPEQH